MGGFWEELTFDLRWQVQLGVGQVCYRERMGVQVFLMEQMANSVETGSEG